MKVALGRIIIWLFDWIYTVLH